MFHPATTSPSKPSTESTSKESLSHPVPLSSRIPPSRSHSHTLPDSRLSNPSSIFSSTMSMESRQPSVAHEGAKESLMIPSMADLSITPRQTRNYDSVSIKLDMPDEIASRPVTPSKIGEEDQLSQMQSTKHTISSASTPFSYSTSNSSCVSMARIDKEYLLLILKLPLTHIKSDILRLSKDQYGCRFLQKKLDEQVVPQLATRRQNFEIIFDQVFSFSYELIIDPFGNYLVQKLIQYCSQENLNTMLEILLPNLFQISINQHGTRALQKMIESLTNSFQLNLLIGGLQPYIIDLIKDLNGNHVIQRLLFKYNPQECQFIYGSIVENMRVVATHKHGCCVLQKCLKHVTPSQLDAFASAILNSDTFRYLINDQFGNYVLQYLISLDSWKINYAMFQNFCNHGIQTICTSKFSSNVSEKFLKNAYQNEGRGIEFSNLKLELIFRIFSCDLNKLVNDPYGNYVVQTSIDVLSNLDAVYYTIVGPEPSTVILKAEKLAMLVPTSAINLVETEGLEATVIKRWFQSCSISSTYGKRIQSKINAIVYPHGPKPVYDAGLMRMVSNKGIRASDFQPGHSHSQSGTSIGSFNAIYPNNPSMYGNGMAAHPNGGANGDFLVSENYALASHLPHGTRTLVHPSRRSASISSNQSEASRYSLGLYLANGSYVPNHQQSDSASSTNTSVGGPGGAPDPLFGNQYGCSDASELGVGALKGSLNYGNAFVSHHAYQHPKLQMSQVMNNGLISPESIGRTSQYQSSIILGPNQAKPHAQNTGLDFGLPIDTSPVGFPMSSTSIRHSRNTSAHNCVGNYPQSFNTPVVDGGDHGRFESQYTSQTPLPLQQNQNQQQQQQYLWNSPSIYMNPQQPASDQVYKRAAVGMPLDQSYLSEELAQGLMPRNHLVPEKIVASPSNYSYEAGMSPVQF